MLYLANICHEIYKHKRDGLPDDEPNVIYQYPNYPAFKELSLDKCFLGEVFFIPSLRYVNSFKSVQYMIPCHGRPPVVELDITFNKYDYDLTFYPVNNTSIMIFEYYHSSEPFYLSQLYDINWTNTVPVPDKLLSLPLPTASRDPDILSRLAVSGSSIGRFVIPIYFAL